ncbi:MAG TPA: hypothetical protein DD412_02250, partial [Holosporales bacterium]|nr:hypothetical protein [Holosporales bacterium]
MINSILKISMLLAFAIVGNSLATDQLGFEDRTQRRTLSNLPDDMLLEIIKLDPSIAPNLTKVSNRFYGLRANPDIPLVCVISNKESFKNYINNFLPPNRTQWFHLKIKISLEEQEYTEIAEVNANLRTLNLEDNNLGENGVVTLATPLRFLTNLEDFYLDGNNFGERGMRLLAPILETFTSLKTLGLDDNSIGEGGMQAFAPGLKLLTNLRALNLGKNNLGEGGMQALATP